MFLVWNAPSTSGNLVLLLDSWTTLSNSRYNLVYWYQMIPVKRDSNGYQLLVLWGQTSCWSARRSGVSSGAQLCWVQLRFRQLISPVVAPRFIAAIRRRTVFYMILHYMQIEMIWSGLNMDPGWPTRPWCIFLFSPNKHATVGTWAADRSFLGAQRWMFVWQA